MHSSVKIHNENLKLKKAIKLQNFVREVGQQANIQKYTIIYLYSQKLHIVLDLTINL